MPDDLPKSVGFSRRHLLKAVGVTIGALGAALPGKASAQSQEDGQGWGWGHCFLHGTLIRGVDGYRPIETLAAGDRLPTRFSGTAVIRKIISYTVHRDDAGHWPEDCRLVRIRAGALGNNSPARDLFITNAHAIFLDGVLVPIGSLVNGKSISFDERAGTEALDISISNSMAMTSLMPRAPPANRTGMRRCKHARRNLHSMADAASSPRICAAPSRL